jgi:hypothetical protein
MPGRRTFLPSAIITLFFITAISAQSARSARADDECLARPNAPTPQGQHWYYRIDHANNNRHCWRLGPEGLPVQKSTPQVENGATSEVAAQPASPPSAQRTMTATSARTLAETAANTETNTAAAVAPVLWLDAPKVPDLPRAIATLAPMAPMAQTASAADTTPAVNDDSPVSASGPSPTGSIHTEDLQRSAAARPQKPVEIDHTFALLMVMLALLAVTGPILHFAHRRREREVINFKPPRWAPVVALNTPAPRMRMSHAQDSEFGRRHAPRPIRPPAQPERPPAPVPVRPPEPSERLAQALQQLVDRIQTTQRREPDTVPRPAQRATMEMMKSAR